MKNLVFVLFFLIPTMAGAATIIINGPVKMFVVAQGEALNLVGSGGTHEPWFSFGVQNLYPLIIGNGVTPQTISANHDGMVCWNREVPTGWYCHIITIAP